MSAAYPIRWQFERSLDTANKRLAVALSISLVVHAIAYTGWRVAPVVSQFIKVALARVLPVKREEMKTQPRMTEAPPKHEVPLVFVEVDPALASKEPPKDTKYYSTHDSLAANEQPKKADVPKLDGSQTRIVRTMDNPKPRPQPMQPTVAPPEIKPKEPDEAQAKPKTAPEAGDLALTKPQPKPLEPNLSDGDKPTEKPREKPRTIREAMLRNPSLAGEKMKQDGGVERRAHVSMMDVKGSPFGNYDNVFIAMVQERWYNLLENNRFMLDRRGKVEVIFRLHSDGRITQLKSDENTVGEVLGALCERAILDPSPFPKWPTDMRKMVGNDYREVRFTFYYD